MRTPRAEPRRAVLLGMVAVAATATLLATGGRGAGQASAPAGERGRLGGARRLAPARRDRRARRSSCSGRRRSRSAWPSARGAVGAGQERAWTDAALAAQKLVISRLAAQGVRLTPDYSFSRVLDGFSAAARRRAQSRCSSATRPSPASIRCVSPIRRRSLDRGAGATRLRPRLGPSSGDPAARPRRQRRHDRAPRHGRRRRRPVPARPRARRDRLVGGDPGAYAAASPSSPSELERHGTEMAGLLVGGGGPSGIAGVATGASLLPIRVAGWQPDSFGHWVVYARSDQLIAGLDRAVDPNDDGDAHDAVRVALVPLAEPFAGFADGPEARAVAGALALDTLVVAPAGNDGAAGALSGAVSGPGGAPAALTVGAADTRPRTAQARVEIRSGLATLFAGTLPLAGAVAPSARLSLEIAGPRTSASRLPDFFSPDGVSRVAGRAAFVARGLVAARRRRGGGHRRRVGGAARSSGSRREGSASTGRCPCPSSRCRAPSRARCAPISAPARPRRSRSAAAAAAVNSDAGRVASFSSTGPAFDGSVKPDLVGPGVALATSDPGADADGSPRFVTVNGTSAAAATVAGAAALLAQARPSLDAPGRSPGCSSEPRARCRPTRSRHRAPGSSTSARPRPARLAAAPATLALAAAAATSFALTNVSARAAARRPSPSSVRITAPPPSASRSRRRACSCARAGASSSGCTPAPHRHGGRGGRRRRPHAPAARSASRGRSRPRQATAICSARSRSRRPSFRASDTRPALLTRRRGPRADGVRLEGDPAGRTPRRRASDRADGTHVGLLARLRDVLPGRYTFGLTGRDATGRLLPPGKLRRPRARHVSRRRSFE